MPRLPLIDPGQATGLAKTLLDAVGTSLGRVPNLMRGLANSPAALKAYLDFSGALHGASLSARVRELIALAVAEVNGCAYCLAIHAAIGGSLGLSREALNASRAGRSEDPRTAAILRFSQTIVLQRGRVSDADLRAVRAAGVTDGQMAEIVATTVLNVFTNWFNHVADTPVEFPAVEPLAAGEAPAFARLGGAA
jgi:uncharacterized peroxidase-related enzyme